MSVHTYTPLNEKNAKDSNDLLRVKTVYLLVSDTMGFCCVIILDLMDLMRNTFESDFNDSITDQLINIKHLIKLESIITVLITIPKLSLF